MALHQFKVTDATFGGVALSDHEVAVTYDDRQAPRHDDERATVHSSGLVCPIELGVRRWPEAPCADAYDGGMKSDKAPGYWPTRILLAVAIIATAIAVAFALWSAFWAPPTFSGSGGLSSWELPNNVVLAVLGAAIAVIGLIWTIRIFRGPRDEPPTWRHRDH